MSTVVIVKPPALNLTINGGTPGLNGVIATDAPNDGKQYTRKDSTWEQNSATGTAVTPVGGITASDVQQALEDLDGNIGGGVTKAEATQSFIINQVLDLALSDAVSSPLVGVAKEVAQTGVENGDWDIGVGETRFDVKDFAATTTLTPSATTGSITLTLGTGSFSASDVGMVISGNGGVCVLTATDGSATTTTDFTDTSAIPSGDWAQKNIAFSDDGAQLPEAPLGLGNISGSSYDSVSFDFSTQTTLMRSVRFNSDGTKMYGMGRSPNGFIYQYSLSTAYDVSTATYDSVSFDFSGQEGFGNEFVFNGDGTKFYVVGNANDTVYQYSCSTAYDMSTASYDSVSFSVTTQSSFPFGIIFNGDGTKFYVTDSSSVVYQYSCSTAYDMSTASYDSVSFSFTSQANAMHAIYFNSDGSKMYAVSAQIGNRNIFQYSLSTAYDVGTATYDSNSFDVFASCGSGSPFGLVFNSDYSKWYVTDAGNNTIFQHTMGSGVGTKLINTYCATITNASGQIATDLWTDINSMVVNETLNSAFAYYAWSDDDHSTWLITQTGQGTRDIVRDNAGTWEYNSNATYTNTSWTAASTNDEYTALTDAMAVAANRMNGTDVNTLGDSDFFATTDTLDLSIILFSDNEENIPKADGMTINYDANAKFSGAILGTDYEYDALSTTLVRIKALTANNYKIRIV